MGSIAEIRIELQFGSSTATSFSGIVTVPNDIKPAKPVPLVGIDSTNDKVLTAILTTAGVINVYRDYSTSMTVMKLQGMYFTT